MRLTKSLSQRRNRRYDGPMAESLTRWGKSIWVLLAGAGLGGIAVLYWGANALWALGGLAVAAWMALRWFQPPPVARKVETGAREPLPALARSVLERLPAPVMML